MSTYDWIGTQYDTTRCADPYITQRLVHHLGMQAGKCYLDIGCGSGNYTMAVAKFGGAWYGCDVSQQMITLARNKTRAIDWVVTDASELPYPDDSFAGVMCTLAIHHFQALLPVFKHTYRVLKEGRFVIFTSTPKQMEHYWLNRYFPVAMQRSIKHMPNLDLVCNSLHEAGFQSVTSEPYSVHDNLCDLFLYSGKHKPHLYLSAEVRAQISTFSLLADSGEIEAGCRRLAIDIESGYINQVIEVSPSSSIGDYLFIVAQV